MAKLYLNTFKLELSKPTHNIEVVTDTSQLNPNQLERLKRNAIRLSREYDNALWQEFPELNPYDVVYFVNWELEIEDITPSLSSITLMIAMNRNIRLAKAWMVRQIVRYFRGNGCPCECDFIGRVVVYEQQEQKGNCLQYQKYALKPNYHDQCAGWQLDVMPLGISKVFTTPHTELGLGDVSYRVIAGLEVVKKERIDDRLWHYCNGKFYPIVNRQNALALGSSTQYYHDKDKYQTKDKLLKNFAAKWMAQDGFASALNIHFAAAYTPIKVLDENIFHINSANMGLKFGKYLDLYTRRGFSTYGCDAMPKHVYTYFFIYPQSGESKVAMLREIFTKGLNHDSRQSLPHYSHKEVIWDMSLDYCYHYGSQSLAEIVEHLIGSRFAPDKKYMAIVLTDHKGSDATENDKQFYYRMKQELLRKGVVSQMVNQSNIISGDNMKWTLHNMYAAIVAKQGGKPWSIANHLSSRDLIIGVGASKKNGLTEPYLGSAVYFDFLGNYYSFDSCKAKDIEALKHSITKAILGFLKERKAIPDRLIIHYYKTMNKRESKMVEDALKNLMLTCPVYVVNMVTATEDDLVAFDMSSKRLMPISGTYVRLRSHEYLLYCNERLDLSKETCKVTFPIKMNITKGNSTHDEKPIEEVERDIIIQSYQFCRIYYRSVNVQNRPITIAYTELLADYVANFEDGELPEFGANGLWML